MGRPGNRKKSGAQRELEGNRGKRPIPAEPEFQDGFGRLEPPKRWRSRAKDRRPDGLELEEWERIVPELIACGIAKAVHQSALERVCELHAAAVRLYQGEDYVKFRNVSNSHRIALTEFGLTPSSAPGLGNPGYRPPVPGKEPEEPVDTADKYFTPRKVG